MKKITLQEAEEFAANANINGVAAFLRQPEAKEYEFMTIHMLKESLMQAYIKEIDGAMDIHIFSNIQRIGAMEAGKFC